MDLTTRYLGLVLPHPFHAGRIAPHTGSRHRAAAGGCRRARDRDALAVRGGSCQSTGVEPHEYLEQLRRIKRRIDLPVIASLNGTTAEGWLRYAR